jgi:hypothetical protein
MIGSNEKRILKTVAFDGGAGNGAVGTVNLFTITGAVYALIVGICTEDLTEAGATATIEVGVAGDTACLIAQVNAVNIDNGELWFDATPANHEVLAGIGGAFLYGTTVIATVGVQNVTDGTLTFACFWTPLSANGNVVAA